MKELVNKILLLNQQFTEAKLNGKTKKAEEISQKIQQEITLYRNLKK